MFDLLSMHADAAAGGDEDVTVVKRVFDVGQAGRKLNRLRRD
jgi:hypothetical protein